MQSTDNRLHTIVVSALALVTVLWLSGCQQNWNNPYPDEPSQANTLYLGYNASPNHLDPARSYSSNEARYTAQIYEPPLQYHYLKRPYELTDLAAEYVSEPLLLDKTGFILPSSAKDVDRSVWTIRIKPGRYYQPHPAFALDEEGKPRYRDISISDLIGVDSPDDFKYKGTRELVADDYIYEIKRLADPTVGSPIFSLMAEHIAGFKHFAQNIMIQRHAMPDDVFLDLSGLPMAGVKKIDRYTFQIILKGRYPQFRYWLAMPFFAPVPVEALRFYHHPKLIDRDITLDTFPVGTGPYYMTQNRPNKRIILRKNPNFAGEPYPAEGEPGDKKAGLLKDAGQTMPFIDKVVYSLEPESIPYWKKFLQGYYDISGISSESFDQVIQFGGGNEAQLTPEIKSRHIRLETDVAQSIFYLGFNMRDDVIGGYSPQARRLRRAISIAVNYEDFIKIFLNGRGVPAQGPIPPQIFGHDPADINPYVYDPKTGQRRSIEQAKKLLAEAGYPGGIDPKTGHRLTLHLDIAGVGPGASDRLSWYRKQFDKLNIRLVIRNTTFNRLQRKMSRGNIQLYSLGWIADYPDPENFLFLLYGGNSMADYGGENVSNFNNRNFNMLYGQMRVLPDSPARARVIDKMRDIVRRDAPWVWGFYPKNYELSHQWLKNRKFNAMANNTLKYLKIDTQARAEYRRKENQPLLWPLGLGVLTLFVLVLPAFISYRRWQKRRGKVATPARRRP